jgi:indolepyruvate decarboxylase
LTVYTLSWKDEFKDQEATSMLDEHTVGGYLVRRLEQMGLKHIFGVPGDYVMEFMDQILQSSIRLIGNCNELNAGYAADGYARVAGFGAVVVTYNVGGFSAYNAIAGAYAENVPVLLISGAPTCEQARNKLPMHHLVEHYDHQRNIYSHITVVAENLENPETAPNLIDRALMQCIGMRKPVYLELPMDRVASRCDPPSQHFSPSPRDSDPDALRECVEDAFHRLRKASHPAVLIGSEVDEIGLRQPLLRLLNATGFPTAVTLNAMGTLSAGHPVFLGMYMGALGDTRARTAIETADLLLFLGAVRTDITSAGFSGKVDQAHLIKANNDGVRIGRHTYEDVYLRDFLPALAQAFDPNGNAGAILSDLPAASFEPEQGKSITADRFFERLNCYLDRDIILVADTGDTTFQILKMNRRDRSVLQSYYLSIGYSLPAALGVALAAPECKTVLTIGDGAFQMTANEVSTIVRNQIPVTIFVLNNDGYVIERMLHHEAAYNDINRWNYADLPKVFGPCTSILVQTEEELESAFSTAERSKGPVFIEIRVARNDCSAALRNIHEMIPKH